MSKSDPTTSGIYRIRCLANGKVYIGSAVDFAERWRVHVYELDRGKHHSRYLQRAWNKHGPDGFVFEVIEYADQPVLIEREQWHLDNAQACNPRHGYNTSPTAGSQLGFKHSEETRAAYSEARKGRVVTPETKARIRAKHLGRVFSPETKAKMKAARRNKPLSPAQEEVVKGLAELSRSKTGLPGPRHTDDAKAKMAAAQHRRYQDPEIRQKMIDAARRVGVICKGKPHKMTPEGSAGIAEANRQKALDPQWQASQARRNQDPNYRAMLAAKLQGHVVSDETRAKISAANKGRLRGRKRSPEAVAKTAAANRGRVVSPETRAKIAAALQGRSCPAVAEANRRRAKSTSTQEN
jgi:group I intron endonuclease